jgi:hypothetical protein
VQALPSSQTIATWSHRPVPALHESVVQTSPSSQEGGGPPTQTPPVQVSPAVQASLSSHGALLFVCVQAELTHASSVQTLPSSQSASALQTATMSRHQPVIDPESPEVSSTTQRSQVPFGFSPLKVASVVAALGVGAGAANGSPAPMFVGL